MIYATDYLLVKSGISSANKDLVPYQPVRATVNRRVDFSDGSYIDLINARQYSSASDTTGTAITLDSYYRIEIISPKKTYYLTTNSLAGGAVAFKTLANTNNGTVDIGVRTYQSGTTTFENGFNYAGNSTTSQATPDGDGAYQLNLYISKLQNSGEAGLDELVRIASGLIYKIANSEDCILVKG